MGNSIKERGVGIGFFDDHSLGSNQSFDICSHCGGFGFRQLLIFRNILLRQQIHVSKSL